MRASGEMAQLCEKYGVKLICFGVLAGGFLSDKYVDMPEPRADGITDWSRMKYRRFFDLIGGWDKLQAVLRALRKSCVVARKIYHPSLDLIGRLYRRASACCYCF